MSIDRISEAYYTGVEARKKLGMDRDAFNNRVRAGLIKRTRILGKYYYEKEEINRLAQLIEAAFLVAKGHSFVYRTAALEDLDAEDELALLNFGPSALKPENCNARSAFVKTNPHTSHHLYDRNHLVASINFVPLTHDAILEFKDKGRRGWTFDTAQIEQFMPGIPLECIIIDMMTTPLVPYQQREKYAALLLRGFSYVTLKHWGSQGIEIVKVYSSVGTSQGKQLLEDAGFIFLGKHNGRAIYELTTEKADTLLLKPYKEALEQWRGQQSE